MIDEHIQLDPTSATFDSADVNNGADEEDAATDDRVVDTNILLLIGYTQRWLMVSAPTKSAFVCDHLDQSDVNSILFVYGIMQERLKILAMSDVWTATNGLRYVFGFGPCSSSETPKLIKRMMC